MISHSGGSILLPFSTLGGWQVCMDSWESAGHCSNGQNLACCGQQREQVYPIALGALSRACVYFWEFHKSFFCGHIALWKYVCFYYSCFTDEETETERGEPAVCRRTSVRVGTRPPLMPLHFTALPANTWIIHNSSPLKMLIYVSQHIFSAGFKIM